MVVVFIVDLFDFQPAAVHTTAILVAVHVAAVVVTYCFWLLFQQQLFIAS